MASRYDQAIKELNDARKRLEKKRAGLKPKRLAKEAKALDVAANALTPAFCGSWFGYHSSVYYRDFQTPPPGHHFSVEWGLMEAFSNSTSGYWIQYVPAEVENMIYATANIGDPHELEEDLVSLREVIEEAKEELLSVLTTIPGGADNFLDRVIEEITKVKCFAQHDWIAALRPTGQIMSRDAVAIQAGMQTPPHYKAAALALACLATLKLGDLLIVLANRAVQHMTRKSTSTLHPESQGTRIFIGHGRSPVWKELRDFLRDRLGLEWEEFNRVPTAGQSTLSRLQEMVEASAFAFLVMTPEDEQPGGDVRARENVVHEAGLFQGRLGFSKAIILREEGCAGFSNIDGLGEIRFTRGNIHGKFEAVREVLEREKIINPALPASTGK